MSQTLHQNVTNVTKQNIASKEILMIEFHTKYMKLFVNMLSVICVLPNTKFHNTSENFYFEVILSRTIVSCKVTNVTNRFLIFKDLYVLTRTGCTIINQKFVDSMFVPGAATIQQWNFPLFLVTNVMLEWAYIHWTIDWFQNELIFIAILPSPIMHAALAGFCLRRKPDQWQWMC